MNLMQIRDEVLARGFDQNVYGARIDNWINDACSTIARRVDYYIDEAVDDLSTVSGTSNYPLPALFARGRNLTNLGTQSSLTPIGLRDIDNALTRQGQPYMYAYEGATLRLYPTPDNIYSLQFRYWALPATLVADTDTPTLPADMHNVLWLYATWQAFEADDDSQMGQYWQQRWNTALAEVSADLKFINGEIPNQARGMWGEDEGSIAPGAWVYYR